MASAKAQWVRAIDPQVQNLVQRGITDAEIISIVLDQHYPSIKPQPTMAQFMVVLNERMAHWGGIYKRDAKGRRTNGTAVDWTWNPAQHGPARDGLRQRVNRVRALARQLGDEDEAEVLKNVTRFAADHGFPVTEAEIRQIVAETARRVATFTDIADMPITPPIKPLAGILHPDELTIPYGTGGSGKGTLAVAIICDLIATYGMRVAILDYEGHSREWVARLKTLYRHRHLQDLPAKSVLYIAPNGPTSGLKIGSFLDHADDLRIACETHGTGYVVLDSVAGGATLGMDPKDDQTATQFTTAWQRLALPMMALSHIPKNSPTTDYPYGSAYWHNLARATWFMEVAGRLQNGFVSRLTNKKFNDADQQPSLMVEVEYTEDGWLESVTIEQDDGRSFAAPSTQAGIAVSILEVSGVPMTAQDVLDVWPVGKDVPDVAHLRARLNELVLAGTISRPSVGGGRGSASTYSNLPAAQAVPEAPDRAEVVQEEPTTLNLVDE